ncbi:hypothetical protein M0812_07522 [Anaeramoeba flamelloides]|uniref:Cyclin N-terminal domain-containing protein n=1 Tax=Anaeramoeba flamelloides TaxID=1746091 RepID=A0AAV8A4X5_9EUKA|nr:hypothetical protein M0812_07522 [Anaeramoeba flamelloides]
MNNFYDFTQALVGFWVDFVKLTEHSPRNNTPEHFLLFENSENNLNLINDTISKIFCSCPCSYESLVHSVEVMRRVVVLNKGLEITSKNCLHLLITSIMVSSKFCDDTCYDNQSYVQIFGISLGLINRLEVAFLFSINWNLVLEEGEFEDTLEIIYKKQYGLFYPNLIQNPERVTSNELLSSPTKENPNEMQLSSELNREAKCKLKDKLEITSISPTVIKRNSRNSIGPNQGYTKEKTGIFTHYYSGNYYSDNDHLQYISPKHNSCSFPHLTYSPFTDEEQKPFMKTENYSNEILSNHINYHPNQEIDRIFNNFDHNYTRKREIPKNYFKEQILSKNRIKNPNYHKNKQINVSNHYF